MDQDLTTALIPSSDPTTDYDVSASSWIEKNLTKYAADVFKTQFPSMYDGLKKVHQRFIYTITLDNALETPIRSRKLVGAMADIHPFSPDSLYDALMRLGQKWNINPPLIQINGNNGSYSGANPAADRYTAMGSTAFTRAVFFRAIDIRVLPTERGPSSDMEPQYFVPIIPTALLFSSHTIGYGYQSKTAGLLLANICDLVSAYAEHANTHSLAVFDYRDHVEKFIPEFPTPCLLTNADNLRTAYAQGEFNAKIKMDGRVVIKHDRIIIESMPHGISFEPLREDVERARELKNGTFDRKIMAVFSLEQSKEIGGLTIELKRGVNPFEVLEDLDSILKVSGSFVPNPNYVMPDGRIISLNYINLLAVWYKARSTAIMATKRRQLQDYKRQQWKIEAQLVAVAHTDRVVHLIRTSDSKADAMLALQLEFSLTPYQAESLTSLQLDVLTRLSGINLEERRSRILEKIVEINGSFATIGLEISDAAQKLKKEFVTPRVMHIPHYIGYVEIDRQGLIQVESWAEIQVIADDFPKSTLHVEAYKGSYRIHLDRADKPTKMGLSKHMRGSIASFTDDPKRSETYTVNLRDGAGCYVDGTIIAPPGRYAYVGRTAMVMSRRGEVRVVDLTETFSQRKTIESRGANTDVVYAYPEQVRPYYVVILNPSEKNIVHLQRVEPHDRKIVISPVGHVTILHHQTGVDWFIDIPEDCLNRCSVRLFQITDAAALIPEGSRQIKLDLGTPKLRRNPHCGIFS